MLIKIVKYIGVSLVKLLAVAGLTFAKVLLALVLFMFVILMFPYWFYTTKRHIEITSDRFFKPSPIQKPNSAIS
ncbi:MAG: hypothetical protein M0D57_21140 [Sphingobacteriales bacterium JAD_PAG50586_3]|nr:MAG: hypothetical protein M0D57_21140 [Sphingobacteriales bacterium JAD_PAG50586_3]